MVWPATDSIAAEPTDSATLHQYALDWVAAARRLDSSSRRDYRRSLDRVLQGMTSVPMFGGRHG
jgi:hypothetical protein